jgi:hypothetical protein
MARKHNWPGHTPLPKGLAAPARRALAPEGIETLEQLADYGEKEPEPLQVPRFGPLLGCQPGVRPGAKPGVRPAGGPGIG